MKRVLLVVLGIVLFFSFAELTTASSATDNQAEKNANELTGKNLPPYVEAARKQLCEELHPECVGSEQIRYIKNIEVFFSEHCITNPVDQDLYREQQAFVFSYKFPIFLNGDYPSFQLASKEYLRNPSFVVALAGIIRHERVHSNNDPSEVHGYGAEIQYLERMQKKGKFENGEAYLAKVKSLYGQYVTDKIANGSIPVSFAPGQPSVESSVPQQSNCEISQVR